MITLILMGLICLSMFAVSVDARRHRRVRRHRIWAVPRPIVPLTQEDMDPENTHAAIPYTPAMTQEDMSYSPPLTQEDMNPQGTPPLTQEDMLK